MQRQIYRLQVEQERAGKQRWFAEPPHMQASMLFLPHGSRVPEVGEDVDVRVRYTATSFDRVLVTG